MLPYRYTVPTYAFDGQAGVILGAYRHYRSTGDRRWLATYWPKIFRSCCWPSLMNASTA